MTSKKIPVRTEMLENIKDEENLPKLERCHHN